MNSAADDEYARTVSAAILPAGDLFEFFWRWQEFRQVAVKIPCLDGLSETERMTIDWMIALIDRIGEHDLTAAENEASTGPQGYPLENASLQNLRRFQGGLASGSDEEEATS